MIFAKANIGDSKSDKRKPGGLLIPERVIPNKEEHVVETDMKPKARSSTTYNIILHPNCKDRDRLLPLNGVQVRTTQPNTLYIPWRYSAKRLCILVCCPGVNFLITRISRVIHIVMDWVYADTVRAAVLPRIRWAPVGALALSRGVRHVVSRARAAVPLERVQQAEPMASLMDSRLSLVIAKNGPGWASSRAQCCTRQPRRR